MSSTEECGKRIHAKAQKDGSVSCSVDKVKVSALKKRELIQTRRGLDQMTIEIGVLTAMAIGIIGAAILTGWCLYSRNQEKKNAK